MKLKTEKGKWIVRHNERDIDFKGCGVAALYYCFIMKDFVTHIAPPARLYPVRSLVPRPKKRRVTKKWKEKIKRIKRNYEVGMHGE